MSESRKESFQEEKDENHIFKKNSNQLGGAYTYVFTSVCRS